jgi:hypothetical protein
MYLVKLNATTSTNSYLRDLLKKDATPDWTVVMTEFQSLGRGLAAQLGPGLRGELRRGARQRDPGGR